MRLTPGAGDRAVHARQDRLRRPPQREYRVVQLAGQIADDAGRARQVGMEERNVAAGEKRGARAADHHCPHRGVALDASRTPRAGAGSSSASSAFMTLRAVQGDRRHAVCNGVEDVSLMVSTA